MIVIAGSANADLVTTAHHIPAPGETILGNAFHIYPGGKGANQAVAAGRNAAGSNVAMLLALGQDANGDLLAQSLRGAGVRLYDKRVEGASGCALIVVAADGENAIVVVPGANSHLTPAEWRDDLVAPGSYLLMQMEIPLEAVSAYARAAKAKGARVMLNLAPARPIPASLLADLDCLLVNEIELAMAAGAAEGASIAAMLGAITLPRVVVTLGKHGSCTRWDGAFHFQPAFPVQVVDTTGAGDTFCGALVAELDVGSSIANALRYASAASALACTRAGAQSSIPKRSEVLAFLSQQPPQPDPATVVALKAFCGLQ